MPAVRPNPQLRIPQPRREDTASLGGSVLVLNTGRSKGQLMSLLERKDDIIAVPDVIVTAVGTKIWHRRSTHRAFGGCTSDDYEEDTAWTTRLDHNWSLEAARKVAAEVGLGAPARGRGRGRRGLQNDTWSQNVLVAASLATSKRCCTPERPTQRQGQQHAAHTSQLAALAAGVAPAPRAPPPAPRAPRST